MFVRHGMTILVVALVCQIGLVLGNGVCWAINDGEAPLALDNQDADAPLLSDAEDSPSDVQTQPGTQWVARPYRATTAHRPTWTVDYRIRSYFDSHTSYEFGTAPGDPAGPYAPLSKLDFELDSTWHGLQVGLEKPGWRIHFEWLTPMQEDINGDMADYDWNINVPRNDPTRLDSWTLSSLRWTDGQVLDLGGEFKLKDRVFGFQVEIWPTAGFRFQRFDMMASDLFYVVPPLGPQPALAGVDVISFQQEYYQCYIGGQVRTTLRCAGRPIQVGFQADGGPTWGYNVDHHLLRDDFIPGVFDRFTMETTSGGMWHLALTAETPVTESVSLGLQVDHMGIRTTGEHRYFQASGGVDTRWTNGVKVESDQTSLTGFARVRF